MIGRQRAWRALPGNRLRALSAGGMLAVLALGCGDDGSPASSVEVTRSGDQAEIAQAEPGSTASGRRDFESVGAAVDFLQSRIDVPVDVPSNLPRGTSPRGVYLSDGSAQLSLRLPDGKVLTIQYGGAGLDGCGGEHTRQITFRGRPAVLNAIRPTTGGRHTALVWPATKRTLRGRYGLSGNFTPARILSFARAMRPVRAGTPRGAFLRC